MANMNKYFTFLMLIALAATACSPKISTNISKKYSALDYREDVVVLGIKDEVPENAERIGTVKIGDAGFTINCGFDVVIEKAKTEARKNGGNAIKIIKHTPPSMWGSSCHQITAEILKIDALETTTDTLINADYALLHIYRQDEYALLSLDLRIENKVICSASSHWKETMRIDTEGLIILWTRTEVKAELPIEIQFGKEYYIRCGVTTGVFVGHPKLELVDNKIGKVEFQSIPEKKKK